MLSDLILDHFHHPRNQGSLQATSGSGFAGCVPRAQFMRIQVLIVGQRVVEASFQTFGCAGAIACGSYLTEWIIGRAPAEAEQMPPARLDRELGGLPVSRRFCASLAVEALQAALAEAARANECS